MFSNSKARRHPWPFNFAIGLISLSASLLLAELAARSFWPAAPEIGPNTSRLASFQKTFQYDPLLGWSLRPNANGRHQTKEFDYSISTNEFGMREEGGETQQPAAGETRLALVGDSFAWGYGVEEDDFFSEVIEHKTGVELLNFGVPSYGPTQYLLLLPKVLSFKPQLVILAFCLSNDWYNSVTTRHSKYSQPYSRLDQDGELVIQGYPLENSARLHVAEHYPEERFGWLGRNSRLLQLSLEMLPEPELMHTESQEELFDEMKESWIYHPDKLDPQRRIVRDHAFKIVGEILEEMKSKVEAAGAKFVILAVPTKCEYSENCSDERPTLNLNSLNELKQITDSRGIALIDPHQKLALDDFYENDTHWRESGHKKIAAEVIQYLILNSYAQLQASQAHLAADGRYSKTL